MSLSILLFLETSDRSIDRSFERMPRLLPFCDFDCSVVLLSCIRLFSANRASLNHVFVIRIRVFDQVFVSVARR